MGGCTAFGTFTFLFTLPYNHSFADANNKNHVTPSSRYSCKINRCDSCHPIQGATSSPTTCKTFMAETRIRRQLIANHHRCRRNQKIKWTNFLKSLAEVQILTPVLYQCASILNIWRNWSWLQVPRMRGANFLTNSKRFPSRSTDVVFFVSLVVSRVCRELCCLVRRDREMVQTQRPRQGLQ